MQIDYTIEYTAKDGTEYCFDVEFEGHPKMVSDSFSYAGTHCTGGTGGVHELPAYPELDDDATLIESGLTMGQIAIVNLWLKLPKNQERVNDEVCEQWDNSRLDY